MPALITLTFLALMICFSPVAVRAQGPEPGAPTSVLQTHNILLPDTHYFVIRDPKSQVDYRIYVALPQGYDKGSTRYPVLFTLDADGTFALAAQAYRLLRVEPATPELVIIGIGYEMTGPARRAQRERDLTPTRSRPESATGEAAAFLAFITGTLIPAVEANYRIDSTDRAIFGHSLGGLFVLYALFEQPAVFQRYIASSPSLWWDNAMMLRKEALFSANRTALEKTVFMSVGTGESKDMLEYFQPFADVLSSRKYRGLKFTSTLLTDETHMTAFPAGLIRGIRTVYARE